MELIFLDDFVFILAKKLMSFWSEIDFIQGINLLHLFFQLCSCLPVTPFHSKHGFTHIYWLLF